MGKVIAVCAMKGGVGKSSLAVNLAHGMAVKGLRTLIWDIDAQGAVAFLLGVAAADGLARKLFTKGRDVGGYIVPTNWPDLDLIAADLSLRNLESDLAEDSPKRLRKMLDLLRQDYDRVILDCPPGLSGISDQIFRAADLLVVPVVPAPLSFRVLDKMLEYVEETRGPKAPIALPVLSMVDRRKVLHRQMADSAPDWPSIPHSSTIESMGVKRAPVGEYAKRSAAAKALAQVLARVEAVVGG
ncbi:ParA family protein [Novosphingobium umbonatum]|uniref:ParA family protein n=1 Tax=Novosphingobium umbonatum TaxID=1908524 RepID=A0A3S2Y6W1_9SPHN|nr:AAA family ATPase [Novosphingobium umbonatum]RVU03600.1 ParA family protein [Novosphingobium umbonatum]